MKSSDVCPICAGPRKPRPENPAFPFCGPRCKLADLGNWLSDRYVLGGEPTTGDEPVSEREKLN
jgi:endogenous inhibitor of DNA gyrase (YacG/DUF329 family)